MPNRILRPGILSSDRVDALSLEAEVFYRRLMSVADDYGRAEADYRILRSNLWPKKVETITQEQIESCLAECAQTIDGEDEPLIFVYFVGRKRYLQITNFGQRIRTDSRFPPPPAEDREHVSQPAARNARSAAARASTPNTTPSPISPSVEEGCGEKPNGVPRAPSWEEFSSAAEAVGMRASVTELAQLRDEVWRGMTVPERLDAALGMRNRVESGEYADPAWVPTVSVYLRQKRWHRPLRPRPRAGPVSKREQGIADFRRRMAREMEETDENRGLVQRTGSS